MFPVTGYAVHSPDADLVPFAFERRNPRPTDVQIEILYCGLCHSDLHKVGNHWGNSQYPMVPGHEIVGRVVACGSRASRFRVGDFVGVGCLVDSCRTCSACAEHLEQYCERGATLTYNDREHVGGRPTFGGFSDQIVVDEHFVLKIPHGANLPAIAPILCAGVTAYSALRHWHAGPGQTVGIMGLGGIGHLGVKLAKALGCDVTVFTSSPEKIAEGRRLGADRTLLMSDQKGLSELAGSFDLVLDTIPTTHPLKNGLGLLKRDRTMVVLGALASLDPALRGSSLMDGRKRLAGSDIGGIAETQEALDFCVSNGIVSEIEILPIAQVNEAFSRLQRNTAKYRIVLDVNGKNAREGNRAI